MVASATKIKFKRTLGKNAPELIATLTYRGAIPAIIEQISNAYDADADNVELHHDPKRSEFVISDDGEGMDQEGLEAFVRLGDSIKIDNPVSTRGRKRLGKFGVGTITTRQFCESYEMMTCHDGTRTVIKERFPQKLSLEDEVEGESLPCEKDKHGTIIKLKGLKFDEADFSLKELRRQIQINFLPLLFLPDFKISVNGEPVEPKIFKSAITFKFQASGEHMGNAEGRIYLTNRQSDADISGIYVYVDGRKIGEPASFMGDFSKAMLAGRVVGVIHANGLKDEILFDRGSFREDSQGVRELKKAVRGALLQVRNYWDANRAKSHSSRAKSKEAILDDVRRILLRTGIPEIDNSTKFYFSDSFDGTNLPGRYDTRTNTLELNKDFPACIPDIGDTTKAYESTLVSIAVHALALSRAKGQEGRRLSFKGFAREYADIWSILKVAEAGDIEKKKGLHPAVIYSQPDLAKYFGKTLGAMHYIYNSCIVPTEEEGITGENALLLERKIAGLVPFLGLLENRLKSSPLVHTTMSRLNRHLQIAGDAAIPFVHTVKKDDSRYYFMEGTCAEDIMDVLSSPLMKLNRADANPVKAFQMLGNQYYSIPTMAERLGLSIDEVSAVIDYSVSKGVPISHKPVGRGIGFKYSDFISALQNRRGTDVSPISTDRR